MNKPIRIILLIFLISPCLSAQENEETLDMTMYMAGLKAYVMNDLESARHFFSRAYSINPESERIKDMYAMILIKLDNEEYVADDPDMVTAETDESLTRQNEGNAALISKILEEQEQIRKQYQEGNEAILNAQREERASFRKYLLELDFEGTLTRQNEENAALICSTHSVHIYRLSGNRVRSCDLCSW